MTVNLSPRQFQFRDPELLPHLHEILKQTGVKPQSLEREITEGVLLNAHNEIDDILNGLSAMGVGIAMDDFGPGYSSLQLSEAVSVQQSEDRPEFCR